MSLTVGILLPNQVSLFSDMCGSFTSGKTTHVYYCYEKGVRINKFTYLVCSGVDFPPIKDFIKTRFEKCDQINLFELEQMSGPLGEISKPFLEENKKKILEAGISLSANNVNLLLGGWTSSSKPFLAHLFCGMETSGEKVGKFDIDIVTDQPGVNFVISPWLGDDTHSEIRRKIHAYLNKWMDGSVQDQRMAGYGLFTETLTMAMKKSSMIGPNAEVVFINSGGISEKFYISGGLRVTIKNLLKNLRRGRNTLSTL